MILMECCMKRYKTVTRTISESDIQGLLDKCNLFVRARARLYDRAIILNKQARRHCWYAYVKLVKDDVFAASIGFYWMLK